MHHQESPDTWITLITFTLPQDAHQARAYLNSMGIETIMTDELTAQVHNFYSTAMGGVKIKIREKDAEEGLKLLKHGGYIQEESEQIDVESIYYRFEADRTRCPYCQSDHIGRRNDPNPLIVLVYLLLGAIFPIFRRTYVCYDCNKNWRFIKKKS